MITFETQLVAHRHAVRLWVPAEQAGELGTARLLPAIVTINGHSVPTTLHRMAGGYLMAVNKSVQAAIGAAAGDTVRVSIEPDTAPRTVDIPDDLAAALSAAGARAAFDALTDFRRTQIVTSVTAARKPDTRARRIAQAVQRLST